MVVHQEAIMNSNWNTRYLLFALARRLVARLA